MFSNQLNKTIALVVVFAVILVGGILSAFPRYKVWSREMAGKATLAEAQWDRQVAIEEAQAELESAKLLRQAELERARGLAEAIDAVKESLQGAEGEAYLRYRWIEGLHNESNEVIYVPTEANLPILEAGRSLRDNGN